MNVSTIQAMGLEYIIAIMGILLARKAFTFRNKGMNYFWRFMIVLDIYLLINIPIRLFEINPYIFKTNLIYWLYACLLIFMTLAMFYWFVFIFKLLDCQILNSILIIHLSSIPAFFIIPLCIINRWTGWLYYIEDNAYYRGPLFILQGIISYCYLFLILIYVIYCLVKNKNRKYAQIVLYALLPSFAGILLQLLYGGSFIMAGVVICASVIYIDICLEKQKAAELTQLKEMFSQTAETLSSAIDAKDEYTHGHSARVAHYAKMIAEKAGHSEEYVEHVYFSGLLHDVGKIGISDEIINKKGKLTAEEYEIIKQHSIKGRDILTHIHKLPYLTMGAKFHHERYDGMGYPDGLKATDIPDIARIIALADAYDAMTSNRSYRNLLSQEVVREEIKNGSGKQFDPEYAEILLEFIDQDKDFTMRQNGNPTELYCMEYYKKFSEVIQLSPYEITLRFHSEKLKHGADNLPTIIIFDSVDSRIHIEEHEKNMYGYVNYCDIRIDGVYQNNSARKMEISVTEKKKRENNLDAHIDVEIKVVKRKDHVVLKISDDFTEIKATVVLTDSSRFAFMGLTGKNCLIKGITCEQSNEITPESSVKRIAEEVVYIDQPEGDIPNLQIDGWRTATTDGIPFDDEMKISFFMRSFPLSRLIWHCPFVILFESDNGLVSGNNFREFAFIRLDGEIRQADSYSKNEFNVSKTEEFVNWDNWKRGNNKGRKVDIYLKRKDNQIFTTTVCGGITIENTTTVSNNFNKTYVSLTGDQIVIESIKINRNTSED